MKKDNAEIKGMILERLATVEFTHTYAIGIHENGLVKAVIIENADEVLPLITVAEKQAESHNAVWAVRVRMTKERAEIAKTYAREVIDLCSIEWFENEYKMNGNRGSYNRGHIFEKLCASVMGGQQMDKMNAKCTECGDIVVNNEHIQCKLWNATVTTEPQVNRFYAEYMAKQD